MITDEQLAQQSIHAFNKAYQIKNEQGQVLDFKDHAFLWDIYNDFSPIICCRKAAQIGFSTLAIIKTLWLAKMKGMQIIYTLPTANDVRQFVGSKTNRIINQNPIFQQWTNDKDSIEQKQVGQGIIHYRGTMTERTALMIAADLLSIDEIDRSDQGIVEQYDSRLQHSKYMWKWLFSNPSVPNMGVDKYWIQSDQKHWFVPCLKCGKEQYLTMANVKPGRFACAKCDGELDRRHGRWVKRYADRTISGYWISLLMAPWITADQILELQKTKSAEYFDNFVLGQPHVGTGNLVTRDTIFRNLVREENPQDGRIVIGVDTGIELHFVCANERGLFYYDKYSNYEDLELLLKRWPKSVMIIDQGGDIIGSRKLREKYPHRVWLCFFRQDRKTEGIIDWKKGEETGTVMADRNKLLQLVVDELTDKRLPIWGTEEDWEDYWLHWSHIYRASEEDNLGVTRHKWMRNDRDDWVLATAYARIGMDRFFNSQGSILLPSDTPFAKGYETKDGRAFIPILPSQYRNQQ